jgi:hypothetical protein
MVQLSVTAGNGAVLPRHKRAVFDRRQQRSSLTNVPVRLGEVVALFPPPTAAVLDGAAAAGAKLVFSWPGAVRVVFGWKDEIGVLGSGQDVPARRHARGRRGTFSGTPQRRVDNSSIDGSSQCSAASEAHSGRDPTSSRQNAHHLLDVAQRRTERFSTRPPVARTVMGGVERRRDPQHTGPVEGVDRQPARRSNGVSGRHRWLIASDDNRLSAEESRQFGSRGPAP